MYRNPHLERAGYRTKPRFSFHDFDLAETEVDQRSSDKSKQNQELLAHARAVHANQTIPVRKPEQPKKRGCNLYDTCVEVVRNDLD